jgi:RNA methyltransferase, TrmH family
LRDLKRIDSAGNPRFKALRRLAQSSRERKESGLSVLDGAHLVGAYAEHIGAPEQLAVSRAGLADPEVRGLLERVTQVEPLVLGDALFKSLSSVATPTGIIAVVRTPRPVPAPQEMDACVMLEGLQDPGNVGSILRSCAAAGVRHVFLSRGSVYAWSPRVLRAAMGAHFLLGIYEHADLHAAARAFTGRFIATSQRAPLTVFDADLTGRLAFAFGNEGGGITPALKGTADAVISIPMPGKAESLNVAAAAAVCLFERVRQLAVSGER